MTWNDVWEVLGAMLGTAAGTYAAARSYGIPKLLNMVTRAVRVGVSAEMEPVAERVDVLEAKVSHAYAVLQLPPVERGRDA